MTEAFEPPEPAIRTLDAEGRPVAPGGSASQLGRTRWIAGGVVGLIVVLAVGTVIAWRALVGSPYGAAEAIPADADIVVAVDFLQIRDTERAERFIQAFAEPMAAHGLIDDVPDFDAALQQFDDEAEAELGFRFAEDVFSWVGRSGAFAIWFPDDLFALDPLAPEVVPAYLATLEVRDEVRAQAFLDRMVAEAGDGGVELEPITVAGKTGYAMLDQEAPAFLLLHEGRFLLADSLTTLRRAIDTSPGDSVAQTAEFQQLASATGGDPLLTMYLSSAFGEQMAAAYDDLGLDVSALSPMTAAGQMAAVSLDDDGILVRSATPAAEQFPVAGGRWEAALPADTYGFVDLVLPDAYFDDVAELYLDVLLDSGLTPRDIDELTAPVNEVIGMSLLDDLLPQFGGEMLFAAGPARDGVLAVEAGIDLGVLLSMGVQDASVVQLALDNALQLMVDQGYRVTNRPGAQVIEADGLEFAALTVTADALVASSSPDMLGEFTSGAGGLGDSERYQRIDDILVGDGLAMYVDIAAIVAAYGTEPEVRDVLAPLVAAGASYAVEGDLQVTEFRVVVEY